MERWISLFGLIVMLALAWLLSANKRRISLRVVVGGMMLQFAFALLVLKTAGGRWFFERIGDGFTRLLNYVDAGSTFVFGPRFQEFLFAFKVLPTIIFFSAFMSLLYHLGIIQRLVQVMAILMQRTLGTSGAESLSAAANIFVGQTEAPLVIRPYVGTMTRSELMAVMVGGFATIAGGVLAAYVGFGISAVHLISASVISAPAGLVIAKILEPEVDTPATRGIVTVDVTSPAANSFHALSIGARDGLILAANVGAMLIAFTALLALAGDLFLAAARQFGSALTLQQAFGLVFYPFAWLMGVPTADCGKVGELLGIRIFANEFIAYEELADWLKDPASHPISPRAVMLATYALCGFSNFASIGIQIGGIGAIAPDRQADLARLGLRAMIGGILASYMTACIAGILLDAPTSDVSPVSTEVKTAWKEIRQEEATRLIKIVPVDQLHGEFIAEFGEHLKACSARLGRTIGDECQVTKLPMALCDGGRDGNTFRAQGHPV